MTVHSSPRGESGVGEQATGAAWTSRWSGGPPSDWDELRARLRTYHDQLSGREDETPVLPPGPAAAGKAAHIVRPAASQRARPIPLKAPSAEDVDYGTVFDLPIIRWWQVHNPLVMQRAVLVLCVMLAILLLLQAF